MSLAEGVMLVISAAVLGYLAYALLRGENL